MLEDCEDAAQEALVAAARQWTVEGAPSDPGAWLIRVGHRRLVDQQRAATSRARREEADAVARRVDDPTAPAPVVIEPLVDDVLGLMLLCGHSALTRASQVALTLRCVAGLRTDEVAAAFLVPSATMGQRLSRARTTLVETGARFTMPTGSEFTARVAAVLDVLHLVFNEGYARTAGPDLVGVELADEAIRLTRLLHDQLPDHGEVAGLLALELLTHARTAARVDSAGELVPLAEQDRSTWDTSVIEEGTALLERVLPRGRVGRYQLQAAIAAAHAQAPSAADTDWLEICLLYGMLERIAPSPAVTLNRAVATAEALSPEQGVRIVKALLEKPTMRRHHRAHAVLGYLRERQGRRDEALSSFRQAARLATSVPEQRHLNRQVARLVSDSSAT